LQSSVCRRKDPAAEPIYTVALQLLNYLCSSCLTKALTVNPTQTKNTIERSYLSLVVSFSPSPFRLIPRPLVHRCNGTFSWTGSSFVVTYVYYSGLLVKLLWLPHATPLPSKSSQVRSHAARLFCFPREASQYNTDAHHIGSPHGARFRSLFLRLAFAEYKQAVAAVARLWSPVGRCSTW
jgi:hypothetical protein